MMSSVVRERGVIQKPEPGYLTDGKFRAQKPKK